MCVQVLQDVIEPADVCAFHRVLGLRSVRPVQFIDLTDDLRAAVRCARLAWGIVNVQTRHTTTGILVNEHEPLLLADLAGAFERYAPAAAAYRHDDPVERTVNLQPGERRNLYYIEHYALVVQDVRGRFDSEGEYHPFIDDGWGEKQDGYDTVVWIRNQTWCNGKIGTFGASAEGITQHLLAGTAPPGLECQFIRFAPTDLYSQVVFQGGAFLDSLVNGWMAQQDASEWVETYKAHPLYDSFWEQTNSETRTDIITTPALHVGGWYDMALKGTINGFLTANRRDG